MNEPIPPHMLLSTGGDDRDRTGPLIDAEPDPVTPDREAMVQAVAEAVDTFAPSGEPNFAAFIVDALAPFFAAAEQRGREQAAQAIEAESYSCYAEPRLLMATAARLARGGQP